MTVLRVEHHVGVEQPDAAVNAATVVKIKSLFMAEISSMGRMGGILGEAVGQATLQRAA